MFLFHLTPAERVTFVGLAKHLIAADGGEGPAETATLSAMAAELGTALGNLPALLPTSEVLGAFVSRSSKATVVLELLRLAYADGLPHPNEMELLQVIAVGLGISELRLLEMENWVVQQMPLLAEAELFLTQDE